MATNKQVQNLAKQLAIIVGKMDEQAGKLEISNSQEAQNKVFSEEISKKINKNINI